MQKLGEEVLDQEYDRHCYWMERAIDRAQAAGAAGEIPVGAVMIHDGKLIAQGENRRQRDHDPTAHAEILALRAAGKYLGTWHLETCTLYVTLEPCPMCSGALILARLGLLVYGADDPKTGCMRTIDNFSDRAFSNHHLPVIPGIKEAACRHLLQSWFTQKRSTQ
jgi:tRNA(adenine34) deaminase